MTQHTDILRNTRSEADLADVLAHVAAAPSHPHMRNALKQHLLDRGLDAGDVDQHLDDWSRSVVRLIAALLRAVTDEQ